LGVTARGEVELSVVVFVSAPAPNGRPWRSFGSSATARRALGQIASPRRASALRRDPGQNAGCRDRVGRWVIRGPPPTARLIDSSALRLRRHLVAGLQVLILLFVKKTLYCTRIVIFLFIYLFMGDFLLFQFVFVSLFNRPLISNLASIACDYTI